jgi:IK cytokine
MLSNKDFAKLLESGGGSGSGSGGGGDGGDKERYSLNQVAQWDRQNRAKREKRERKAQTQDGDGPAAKRAGGATGSDGAKYRDRAKERRKEEDGGGAESLEDIAARLDAEQTKFLGGDVEHTHLVRGLDYALLRKIRDAEGRGTEHPDAATAGAGAAASQEGKAAAVAEFSPTIETTTVLGANLKALLLSANTRFVVLAPTAPSSSSSSSSSGAGKGAAVSAFANLAFEYDVDPDSEQDIPTLISHSRRQAGAGRAAGSDRAHTSSCAVGTTLATKLAALFAARAGGSKGAKRKRKDEDEASAPQYKAPAPKLAAAPPRAAALDDDIFEGAGKYVPVGALEEHEKAALAEAAAASAVASAAAAAAAAAAGAPVTAKGIFSSSSSSATATDRPPTVAAQQHTALTFDDDDDEAEEGEGKGGDKVARPGKADGGAPSAVPASGPDLMAPVRALLNAHAAKPAAAPPTVSEKALRTNAEGKVVVFRDILGTASESVASAAAAGQTRRGDAMVGAGKGSYDDIYPETGDYSGGLNDDSDDDEGDRPKGKGGGGGGGGAKSNAAATGAAKPAPAATGSGVSNRAARRAGK